jgi:hypothetical protein
MHMWLSPPRVARKGRTMQSTALYMTAWTTIVSGKLNIFQLDLHPIVATATLYMCRFRTILEIWKDFEMHTLWHLVIRQFSQVNNRPYLSSTDTYSAVFQPIIGKIMERFQPGAVVMQCGADSLSGTDGIICTNLMILTTSTTVAAAYYI